MVEYVEMHAVSLSGEGEIKLARCGDGDDDDSCYRCAVELKIALRGFKMQAVSVVEKLDRSGGAGSS